MQFEVADYNDVKINLFDVTQQPFNSHFKITCMKNKTINHPLLGSYHYQLKYI